MENILILGDVHLGKSMSLGKNVPGSFLNTRLLDQLNLLDWTLEQALSEECSDIVVTGDIFEDPKPHPSIISAFMTWIKRVQVEGIRIHIVVGNHDVLRIGQQYSSPLDIISEADLDDVFVYKDIDTVFIKNSAITILPFKDRKSLGCSSIKDGVDIINQFIDYESSLIPDVFKKVLIGHLAIEGSIFIGDEMDDISNEIFVPINSLKKYDFTWMGHVHKPQVMLQKPFISHIGSMDISNFGECDQLKYVVIYNTVTGEYKNKNLPTKSLKKVKITVSEDIEDPTAYILQQLEKENVSNSIVKLDIELLSSGNVDKKRLEEKMLSIGANHVAGISETKKIQNIKKDNNELNTALDVKSAIRLYADTYIKEESRSKFIEISNEIYGEFLSK